MIVNKDTISELFGGSSFFVKSVCYDKDSTRMKIYFMMIMYMILFSMIGGKLFCIICDNHLNDIKNDDLAFKKYKIYDDNCEVIATNIKTQSFFINTKKIHLLKDTIEKISKILNMDKTDILNKIRDNSGKVIRIKKFVSPQEKQEILNTGIESAEFVETDKRFYPQKNLLSHIVGKTDTDSKGISGLEKAFDMHLRQTDLSLFIDIKIQHLVNRVLKAGINYYNANSGCAIVIDLSNGGVKAMTSLPDYDPNHVGEKDSMFNIAVSGVYEFGSIMKTITTAMALHYDVVDLNTQYYIKPAIMVGRYRVTDFTQVNGILNVMDIFKKSSNVGMVKIAADIGCERYQDFYNILGLNSPFTVSLPEKTHVLLPKKWDKITCASMSYGYSVAMSPIQMATILSGLVANGIMRMPRISKSDQIIEKQVISKEVSAKLRDILKYTVMSNKCHPCNIRGCSVGGKSGTAHTIGKKGYDKEKVITSFFAFFPAEKPQYLVLVVLNNPQKMPHQRSRVGNMNAAFIAADIIKGMLPIIDMKKIKQDNQRSV